MRYKWYIGLLQRVQRLCCLGISGAIRTTSTRAIETILHIHPIEVQVKYEAALAMMRLRATGEWICKDHVTKHQTILDRLPGNTITETDCDRVPARPFITNCGTQIPDRESWLNGTFLDGLSGIHFYTDGSKMDGKTGLGFYNCDLSVGKSFRLPDHNTVFQAEVTAITECLKYINIEGISGDIKILTDSQAAILAISAETVRSATILRCKEEINNFSTGGSLDLIWVPGHTDIEGNEMADELAREGSSLSEVNICNPKPFQALKVELRQWADGMHRSIWNSAEVGRTTKILWGDPDRSKTKELLKLNKRELGTFMGILTGHSILRAHLYRIGKADSGVCRACMEDDETLEHYLCNCPAFARIRVQTLSSDNTPSLEELRGIDWKRLRNYVNATKFLE